MPYGTMLETTERYLRQRAEQSGVLWSRIGTAPRCVLDEPNVTQEVAVIFDGALDETFYVWDDLYVVNLADWLAEQCATEAEKQEITGGWEIIVSEQVIVTEDEGGDPQVEATGVVTYRTSSWNQ